MSNPVEEFETIPPGLLALECLSYFARHHPEKFAKVKFILIGSCRRGHTSPILQIILENSVRTDGRDYPFVQTSIQIVNHLLGLLNVGETRKYC